MNRPMTIDSTDTFAPRPTGRTNAAPNQEIDDAREDGHGKRRQHRAIGGEPVRVREVDDAEAVEELGDGVAAERDEPPEHERVREAGDGPLDDGPALADDVDEEALNAEIRDDRGRTCWARPRSAARAMATCATNAPTNPITRTQSTSVGIENKTLPRKGFTTEDTEVLCGKPFQDLRASMSAGTISKRSPTMP